MPRTAFIQDLRHFISTLQSNGHDIILGGDFNETLDDCNSGILKLVTYNNLTDPFLYRFPHHSTFGTHANGQRRIDSVLITPTLLPSLLKIGYAPFHYSTRSDHRPLLLEFQTRALFGLQHIQIQAAHHRVIRSNDKIMVHRFISRWYQEIFDRKGYEIQSQLDKDEGGPALVESLDNILGQSGKIAETSCKNRRPQFYSRALVQQRLRVSVLRGHLQALRLGVDRTAQIHRKIARCGIDIHLPTTIRSTKVALCQASADLRQLSSNHAEERQKELHDRVAEAALRGNKTKAQILGAILRHETNKKTYKILQKMRRQSTNISHLDRIEIPASWPPPHQPI